MDNNPPNPPVPPEPALEPTPVPPVPPVQPQPMQPVPQPIPPYQPTQPVAPMPFAQPKKNNRPLIIGLSVGGVAVAAIITLLIIFLLPKNPVIGTWDCGYIDYDDDPEYAFTMDLQGDNSFVWSLYKDPSDYSLRGTYEAEKLSKTADLSDLDSYGAAMKKAEYYSIELDANLITEDGETEEIDNSTAYEMAVVADTNEAVMINERSYSLYSCKKR